VFEEGDGRVDFIHVQFHFGEAGVGVLLSGRIRERVSEGSCEPVPEGLVSFGMCWGVSCDWVSFYFDGQLVCHVVGPVVDLWSFDKGEGISHHFSFVRESGVVPIEESEGSELLHESFSVFFVACEDLGWEERRPSG
jgi:hypothetical protein